jgi:hypothetical protein
MLCSDIPLTVLETKIIESMEENQYIELRQHGSVDRQ